MRDFSTTKKTEWTKQEIALITWLGGVDMPNKPIMINLWTTVNDPIKDRQRLLEQVALGPGSAIAQAALERVKDWFEWFESLE